MLIDVSIAIEPGAVVRPGSPPATIATHSFSHPSQGDYEAVMLAFPAHVGTHLDLVYPERRVDPERMIGWGKLIDIRSESGQTIGLSRVLGQVEIEAGDFVLLRTGSSAPAGTEEFYQHPDLSREVLDWLISLQVNAIGIDAQGLGRGRKHSEYDTLLADNDIYVIENLTNLNTLPKRGFKVYCLPLKIEDVDAMPARVLVEVDTSC